MDDSPIQVIGFNLNMNRLLSLSFTLIALAGCATPPVAPTSRATQLSAAVASAPTVAPQTQSPQANLTDGCVQNYSPDVDYFPEKLEVKDAVGFKVNYFKSYKVVTVSSPWVGATEPFQYVLMQCGTPKPDGFDQAQVIETPVKRVVLMSTTEVPALEQIGALDSLVGLDSFLYVNNPQVRDMINAGKLKEIGSGAQLKIEDAIALKPDVVFTSGSGLPAYDSHPKLLEAKIPVGIDGSYVENAPLGRAEWSKFIALFFNREAIANQTHGEIRDRYNALAEKARAATDKPTAFANIPVKEDWFVPGGKSFAARLMADAGSAYVWADDASTDSLPLKFEQVLDKARDAEVWLINAFGAFPDTQSLAQADSRFAEFAALQNKRVYNNDLRVNENGGNDYYETGAARPDLVLSDLVAIFQPELLPDHKPNFFRKLN